MKENRRPEVVGVLLLALGLLLLISQLSYDPLDPSFTTLGSGTAVHNLAGRAGAYLTDTLFQLFGASSYLMTIFFLVTGWRLLLKRSVPTDRGLRRVGGLFLLLFFFSAFSSLWLSALPTTHGGPTLVGKAGGLAGYLATNLMIKYFAVWGTHILVTAGLIASVMLTTSLSPVAALEKAKDFLIILKEKMITAVIIYREKSRRWKNIPKIASKLNRPKPKITEAPPFVKAPPKQETFEFSPTVAAAAAGSTDEASAGPKVKGRYQLPPLSLLNDPAVSAKKVSKDDLLASSQLLEKKLLDFGIEGKVTQVHPGPVVTLYEVEPAAGVKVNRIVNLSDDLALGMRAMSVRIVAPIPGKSAVGIEIPNHAREDVSLKEILSSKVFAEAGAKLPLALGKDIFGQPVVADLSAMPHVLVAGATGSGKSVALNTMICSILFAGNPQEVKLVMIDPKMLELLAYDGAPHLLCPVVTRPKSAAEILQQMVSEMQRRYRLLAEAGARNIEGYNKALARAPSTGEDKPQPLPYLVIVIDELADLMMVVSREVEDSIARLAQMARASGIHLIVATQRPSVDVITGVIKANFPARMSFQVSSKTDSRTILDANGAEQLLGRGDMLYLAPGTGRITRIHGAYISEGETKKVVDFIKAQESPSYNPLLLSQATGTGGGDTQSSSGEERDELYHKAVDLVLSTGQASASFIQRRMRVGYPRAARMIEIMEEDGILGPPLGARPREILVKRSPFQEEQPQ